MKRTSKEKGIEPIQVSEWKVTRAKDTGKIVFFDLMINGVTIYGCKVIEGQRGDFISFPSQKGTDGKYYNIAWAPLSDEVQADILAAVEVIINK